MKKVLSVVMMLVMLLGCAMAEENITGEWYGLMQGIPATFTLNEDGTYTVAAGNDGIRGVWELSGTALTLDKGTSGEVVFTYDAEAVSISMIMDGTAIMTFTREPIEIWEPAAVRTDAVEADFEGLWDSDMVNGYGIFVEPEAVGLGLVVEIEGNHVVLMPITMTGNSDTMDPTYEAEGTFADGVLTVYAPSIVGTDEITAYAITMLEDGMMAITFDVYGNSFTYYMDAM